MRSIIPKHDRPTFYFVSCVAIVIGGSMVSDAVKRHHTTGMALERGVVIRQIPKVSGWEIRPRVEVEALGKKLKVVAVLTLNGIDDIPRQVSFYYGGDPKVEVHLREEHDPIWGVLFCWGVPFSVLAADYWLTRLFPTLADQAES